MNKCVCCGAQIQATAKMCRKCYYIATHNPCKGCTPDEGRELGCQGHCARAKLWRKCYGKFVQLQKSIRGEEYAYRLNCARRKK